MEEKKEVVRVLLVEDDLELTRINALRLKRHGYEVLCAASGAEVFSTFNKSRVDIILLDVMLPDMDGHEICERLRSDEFNYSGPIIFMSCLGDSNNIVGAFREGGDDYLVKPAKAEELVDRIEVNLKKKSIESKPDKLLWFKHICIDDSSRTVYSVVDGERQSKIELSPTEYNILITMARRPQEVLLYRQLYKAVWEQDDMGDVRTLMVHVSNMRKKVDKEHNDFIRAVRSVGYIFDD